MCEFLHDGLQLRIACAKVPREPVPAPPGDRLAIGDYVELTCLARSGNCVYAEPLFDQGHETRGLVCIAVSGRAVNDFDLH